MNRTIKTTLIILLFMLTELLASELSTVNNNKESAKVINAINKEMKVIFNDALITTEVLKEMVLISENNSISLETFNKMSQTLLSTYNNVDALLLIPNGVVTLVYPYEEHKRAIGHNILQDKNRKQGANQSIVCKKSIIIGPVKLVQNGKQAFILRKGLSNQYGFIGFSSSVIYLDSILNTLENILKLENVTNYSIIGYDPDNGSYYDKVISSKGAVNCNPHKDIINIFNTNWQISISPDDTGIQYRLLSFSVLLVVLFLIISPIKYFNKYRRSEKERCDLQNEAHTDFLTELLNRRGFENRFETLKKENTSGSIAIFDIDFFKNVNDSYGHEVGDKVLVQFSKLCAAKVNSEFTLSRTGGEEFMMLMPHLNQDQAKQYCDQLRESVAKAPFFIQHLHINITVSIGIAYFNGTDTMKSALSYADEALYEAKKTGRNRVCIKD
ncbi:sensor domain-containing diguanylate cyclase [Photobacterium sanguinicancri]|uniref:diguanylate cyclase n=1 Tax=Photobacterium sanguinicancri TaxID=875932 RepID=A0AAW7YCR1_9GAMM|nr:sensor domain-containing diguanylate cyclase [Photobacterium sanguinicancri]MDO6544564.1 sensor domain-containing diguanylate cyclase [Photobacterium sanguinicancri]